MESLGQILGDCLGARLDVQFSVNATEISADGINTDVQLVGDGLVGEPLGQTVQNHFLAR